jgi:hypothetical protein
MHARAITISSQVDCLRRTRPGIHLSLNDNNPADGICPVCYAPAPVVPFASDRLATGRIHEHWLCQSCGFEWTTTAHVVS